MSYYYAYDYHYPQPVMAYGDPRLSYSHPYFAPQYQYAYPGYPDGGFVPYGYYGYGYADAVKPESRPTTIKSGTNTLAARTRPKDPHDYQYDLEYQVEHEAEIEPEPMLGPPIVLVEESAYARALQEELLKEQAKVRSDNPLQVAFAETVPSKTADSSDSTTAIATPRTSCSFATVSHKGVYAPHLPPAASDFVNAVHAAGTEARRRMDMAKVKAMIDANFAKTASADRISGDRLRRLLRKALASVAKEREAKDKEWEKDEDRMEYKDYLDGEWAAMHAEMEAARESLIE